MEIPSNERGQSMYYDYAMILYIITFKIKVFYTNNDEFKLNRIRDLSNTLQYFQEPRMVKSLSTSFGNQV